MVNAVLPRIRHKVDLLIFNPPYVPTPPEEMNRVDIYASWAGGEDGREIIDRFLPTVEELLAPSGVFFLVLIEDNKPDQVISILKSMRFESKVLLRFFFSLD